MSCSNAIILAAGRGSRMLHHTDEHPKCMVPLYGRPLIDWQVAALNAAGIHNIGLVTGYRRELIAHKASTEFHNAKWDTTNMVASLLCASSWLEQYPCIISYSDLFYQPQAIELLKNATAEIAITYDPNWQELWAQRFENPLDDAETFRLTPDGYVAEIGNTPQTLADIEGQYMGLIYMTPKAWQQFTQLYHSLTPEAQRRVHMTGMLQTLIEQKLMPIEAMAYRGIWGELDSDTDHALYQQLPYEEALLACH